MNLGFQTPPEWTRDALCAETSPDEFFPDQGGSVATARGICGRCDVRAECLSYALANHERFGIWGGLTERERAAIIRERARKAS